MRRITPLVFMPFRKPARRTRKSHRPGCELLEDRLTPTLLFGGPVGENIVDQGPGVDRRAYRARLLGHRMERP